MNLYFIVIIGTICFFAFLTFLHRVLSEYQARKLAQTVLEMLKDCKYDPDKIELMTKVMNEHKMRKP